MGHPITALAAVSKARRLLSLFIIFCLILAAPGPASAALFGEFGIKDEAEYGRKFNVLVRSRMPLIQDPEVISYVEDIVRRLEKTMPPQPFPFTVAVIRHNAVNAFATPGGYVFVNTGLILAMNNDSEVAGVLAHELAHVTQRHIAGRIEAMQVTSLLSLLGALAGAFLGGDAGFATMAGTMAASQAAMLKYSRADESEADQVGMNYLIRAGYNPMGMIGSFEVIGQRQWLTGSEIPTYLSTHPGVAERIKTLSQRVAQLPAPQRKKPENNDRFLRVQALVRARYADPGPAARVFEQQLKDPARASLAHMGLGILASRQNRVNDAKSHFDAALKSSPNDPLVIREAGRFHYTKGDRNKGQELLAKAVSMDRNDTMALFYYSKCLEDAGNITQAIQYVQQLLRKAPEDPEIHQTIAHMYGKNRDLFQANLHMAYSALYENNEKKLKQFLDRAQALTSTDQQKAQMERFDLLYKERKEFWK